MTSVIALCATVGDSASLMTSVGPLSRSSRERLARIASPGRLQQSLVARQLVALAASHLLKTAYQALRVVECPDGRGVRLPDSGLVASISHSRHRVAVAVGSGSLGVDVECNQDGRDWEAVARRVFNVYEVDWIIGSGHEVARERFYQLWTLREAMFKAGLRDSIFSSEHDQSPAKHGYGAFWYSRTFDDHCVTVATSEAADVEWLSWSRATPSRRRQIDVTPQLSPLRSPHRTFGAAA